MGGEWVPGPVPTSYAAQGRSCRCLGGWRGWGRERRQEQRGQSLEWAQDTARRGLVAQVPWQGVVGTGQESHVDTRPPTGPLSGGGTALVLHYGLEP